MQIYGLFVFFNRHLKLVFKSIRFPIFVPSVGRNKTGAVQEARDQRYCPRHAEENAPAAAGGVLGEDDYLMNLASWQP